MNRAATLPADLWARAAHADARLLMLDYDGTLAPFRVNRLEAAPPRRLLEALQRIAESRHTLLAVISGRPVSELTRFLGHLPARLFGEHGWESRSSDGLLTRHPMPAACSLALASARAAIQAESWANRLESKRTSLMLHTRGLPPPEAQQILSRVARLWEPSTHTNPAIKGEAIQLRPVNGGLELRARGRDKSTAVRELIAESPPGALPVYVGDDDTDEDAFHEVRSSGFGVLIAPEGRRSQATGRLTSITEMTVFLEGWLMLVEGGRNAAKPPPLRVRVR